MPSTRRRAALALPAAAVLALALSACGDDAITESDTNNSFVPNSMLDMNPETPDDDTIPPPSSLPDPNPQGQSPTDPDGPGDVDQGGGEGSDPNPVDEPGPATQR